MVVVQRFQRHGTGGHLADQSRPESALVIGLVSLDHVELAIEPLSEQMGEVGSGVSLECAVDLHVPPTAGR